MKQLQATAELYATTYGVDPALFKAQIKQESGWNYKARSRAGAVGVAQIMPSTARAWGVNPHNPISALRAAAKNMARYIKTYKRQGHDEQTAHKMALCAYNAGPGAVAKYKGCPPYRETQNYHKTIISNARRAK
jgi:soluble lytic murein transglycosylase-like protein